MAEQRRPEPETAVDSGAAASLEALARSSRAVAEGASLTPVLREIAEATAAAAGADLVVARVVDEEGQSVVARAAVASSRSLAAEVEGTRLPVDDVPDRDVDESGPLSIGLRALGEATDAAGILQLPVTIRGRLVGTLELLRSGQSFSGFDRLVARVAVDQMRAAIRAIEPYAAEGSRTGDRTLELAGQALATALDGQRTGPEIARLAVEASGALSSVLWEPIPDDEPVAAASFGSELEPVLAEWARSLAADALQDGGVVGLTPTPDGVGSGAGAVATIGLGQPPLGVLQLFFPAGAEPGAGDLERLATFGVRAAGALRGVGRLDALAGELERTRALLDVVAGATAELSFAHTVETFVDRIADLLGPVGMCVYLREDGRLKSAAARRLAGPHTAVAERLLDLALGRARARGLLVVDDTSADRRLAGLTAELAESAIEGAVAVPLLARGEVTGLLAVYPRRHHPIDANEVALLGALAGQLAIALQNARLHEQATALGVELEQVLSLEREAARRLAALYEISRVFAQSLSFEATLDAVPRTIVELLDVDAAVLRLPDERGETLVARALHVADSRLEEPIRAILTQPQPLEHLPGRRLLRTGKALTLDAESAARLGGSYGLLVPFLRKGSSAVVLPIRTPTELLGTLALFSLDPVRRITPDTVEIGLSVAAQAALALENARLYQQQKAFADTMQRSLLPRHAPELRGLELGDVYASSARVDVGGDVYDYMLLPDGRLAVVLGDVTGHGIDAAADMAMAKFVFRSLAREHPRPAAFLAAANDVVCSEIGPGKFITMLYVTIDPATGEMLCAGAGHPRPRVVLPDASVRAIEVGGLALGIESGQQYEDVAAELPPGAAVVLYTDGVVEARRGEELFGTDRLDAVLVESRDLPAAEIAQAVIADCRAYAGGELGDDCAVVVIRRTAAE